MENDEFSRDTEPSPVEIPDEIAHELEAEQEQVLVQLERQEVRRRGRLIAALFGRQR